MTNHPNLVFDTKKIIDVCNNFKWTPYVSDQGFFNICHIHLLLKEKAQVSGLELEIPQQELEVVTARRQTKTEDLMYKIDDIPPW